MVQPGDMTVHAPDLRQRRLVAERFGGVFTVLSRAVLRWSDRHFWSDRLDPELVFVRVEVFGHQPCGRSSSATKIGDAELMIVFAG